MSESQKDWHERIHESLWSYRTSKRRSTGTTPFNLVYGAEAVRPVEIELPSLRITAAAELTPEDERYVKNCIAALELLEEERKDAQKKLKLYHERAMWLYNQHAKPRKFKVGMLVLCNTKEVRANLPIPKFAPAGEGPYLIRADVGLGCYDLSMPDGGELFQINAKYLKPWRDPAEGGHVSV